MNEVRYPLATSSWDEAEYTAIERVIKSNFYSMGPEVAAFEENSLTTLVLNMQLWSILDHQQIC